MRATTKPEAEGLADELVKHMGDGPITTRDLAAELAAQDAPATLIGAFEAVLSLGATATEKDDPDDDSR